MGMSKLWSFIGVATAVFTSCTDTEFVSIRECATDAECGDGRSSGECRSGRCFTVDDGRGEGEGERQGEGEGELPGEGEGEGELPGEGEGELQGEGEGELQGEGEGEGELQGEGEGEGETADFVRIIDVPGAGSISIDEVRGILVLPGYDRGNFTSMVRISDGGLAGQAATRIISAASTFDFVNDRAIVAEFDSRALVPIAGGTTDVGVRASTIGLPGWIGYSALTDEIVSCGNDTSDLEFFDASSLEPSGSLALDLGPCRDGAIDQSRGLLWMGMENGPLVKIDLATHTPIGTVASGPLYGVAVVESKQILAVTGFFSGTVSFYSEATGALLGSIGVVQPYAPDDDEVRGIVAIPSRSTGTVVFIDAETRSVVATRTACAGATQTRFNQTNRRWYTTCFDSNQVAEMAIPSP